MVTARRGNFHDNIAIVEYPADKALVRFYAFDAADVVNFFINSQDPFAMHQLVFGDVKIIFDPRQHYINDVINLQNKFKQRRKQNYVTSLILDGQAYLGEKKKINENIIQQFHGQKSENNSRPEKNGAVVDMVQAFLQFFFFHWFDFSK